MPLVVEADIDRLERLMDVCQRALPPLKEFILPGGNVVIGSIHVARTVCRRAERVCVRRGRAEPVDPIHVKFLNRLSDALFVLARWHARLAGEPEIFWQRTSS
jgi:cob(I)alamin adenosyltransferase